MKKAHDMHGYATGGISKIYRRWYQMKDRCYSPKNADYAYYGGRGITVCKRWRDSIQNFIDDMGMPEEGMTLDRLNNNRGYSKSNCAWVSRADQSRNRRYVIRVFYRGTKKMQTLQEVSKMTGISVATLYYRYRKWKKLIINKN